MLKKLSDDEMSYKRWPRTLNEAFGPEAKLTILKPKRVLRDKLLAFALFAAVGAGWYLLVAIKAGA